MLWRRTSRSLALVLHLMALAGCQAKPGAWSFEFSCAALKVQTHTLSTRIVFGTCAAPGRLVYEEALVQGQRGAAPPELAPGPYAFSGRALTAEGAAIGAGCIDVMLPERRDVRIAIQDEANVCSQQLADASVLPDAATNDPGLT